MAMRCESCGTDNPATNRYCGQCGKRMERGAGELPFKPIEASADLPPEIIEFDNHIPLIANNGTDRRLHPPPDLIDRVHDHLEHEAELHDQLQHGSEPHSEVRARQEAERELPLQSPGEYLRWDDIDGKAVVSEDSEPDSAQPEAHHNFLPEGKRTTRTGVSGPSFLGLTDDSAAEYADEEPEPKSHLLRNVALAILAALLILVAGQWRSIRDYVTAHVQNRSRQTTKPSEKGVSAPPLTAADKATADLPLSSAAPKTAASQSSANANPAPPVPAADSRGTAPDSPTSPSPANQQQPAMSAPVAMVPKNEPRNEPRNLQGNTPSKASAVASSRTAVEPRPSRAKESAAPGADEMHRAAHARDAQDRAAWLWKAVGKGNPQAPVELATMYERGNGVARSCGQAEVLLRSAAAKGNGQAKISLQQIRIRGGCSAR